MIVAAALMLVAGAYHHVAPEEIESKRRVEVIWEQHAEVVALAIEGHQEGDQLTDAVQFFAQLTDTEIDVNMSTMGLIPTEKTAHDLERIREWYAEHRGCLYYDQADGSIKLRSPCQKFELVESR